MFCTIITIIAVAVAVVVIVAGIINVKTYWMIKII